MSIYYGGGTKGMKDNNGTKICKHCQTEIPKKAKVCPNCRKKQGGKLKWIIIAIIVIGIIGAAMGGGDDEKIKKTGEVKTEDESKKTGDGSEKTEDSENEEANNIFSVGDIVETDDLKITFVSAGQYQEENEFLQPQEGNEYWRFEFQFENISDSDQAVSSMMDWTCYADNSKVDQTWIGDDNGLDATLSSGRTTQGAVFFEVPVDAESIELEYDINFWQSDKIIFVGK